MCEFKGRVGIVIKHLCNFVIDTALTTLYHTSNKAFQCGMSMVAQCTHGA